jgi:hypothetical protein
VLASALLGRLAAAPSAAQAAPRPARGAAAHRAQGPPPRRRPGRAATAPPSRSAGTAARTTGRPGPVARRSRPPTPPPRWRGSGPREPAGPPPAARARRPPRRPAARRPPAWPRRPPRPRHSDARQQAPLLVAHGGARLHQRLDRRGVGADHLVHRPGSQLRATQPRRRPGGLPLPRRAQTLHQRIAGRGEVVRGHGEQGSSSSAGTAVTSGNACDGRLCGRRRERTPRALGRPRDGPLSPASTAQSQGGHTGTAGGSQMPTRTPAMAATWARSARCTGRPAGSPSCECAPARRTTRPPRRRAVARRHAGDFPYVPEGGVHAFRNESGEPASMLLLLPPAHRARATSKGSPGSDSSATPNAPSSSAATTRAGFDGSTRVALHDVTVVMMTCTAASTG